MSDEMIYFYSKHEDLDNYLETTPKNPSLVILIF